MSVIHMFVFSVYVETEILAKQIHRILTRRYGDIKSQLIHNSHLSLYILICFDVAKRRFIAKLAADVQRLRP
jgi:hypothetical protein